MNQNESTPETEGSDEAGDSRWKVDKDHEREAEGTGQSDSGGEPAVQDQAQPEAQADPEPAPEAVHAGGDEAAKLKEAMLRMRAEMDNREKRMEREMVKARKFAIEALLRDLVPVLDSIDQALAAGDEAANGAMREGLELTRRLALKVLGEHGLEVIDPLDQPFDPSWHEAMTTRPGTAQAADTVVEVLQKGYSLNQRLIRPARVVVARD